VLEQVSPGLFWFAVLFSALLAVGRSFAVEAADGNLDALRLAGLDPAGIFLGKGAAVLVELIVLEVVLGVGAFVLYGPPLENPVLLVTTVGSATVGIAASGTLYGALAAGLRVRDTLVPLLLLPVLAPVLLGASLATEAALFGPAGDGWPWLAALVAFAVLYLGAGILAFGSLLEES
jgi:heme exporter protein B